MTDLRKRRSLLWSRFLRVHALVVTKLADEMRRTHGLPLAWFDVLAQLSLAGGQLRMTDLANRVLLSSSGLTRLVDRMENGGVIVRRPCKEDRRSHWARLTPAGRRRLAEVTPRHLGHVDRYFLRHLKSDEVRSLNRLLRKILEANESVND